MIPRFHVEQALAPDQALALPPNATRHAQVLRLQPGSVVTLFDGRGGEWQGEVLQMGRREVSVRTLEHRPLERELACAVTLALGMPANERMDTLVEKATELGAAAIEPLVCERSVLRVAGERAERKAAHWQGIAVAACEQSGRNRVPLIAAPRPLREALSAIPAAPGALRLLLSLAPEATPLAALPGLAGARSVWLLSGPEGGLSEAEQALAVSAGWVPVSLGPRVLRAETAPLAALAVLGAMGAQGAPGAPSGRTPPGIASPAPGDD